MVRRKDSEQRTGTNIVSPISLPEALAAVTVNPLLAELLKRAEVAEQRVRELEAAARALVDAMVTCHECKSTILIDDGPTHCEDCSYDCECHEEPACTGIDILHQNLVRVLLGACGPQRKCSTLLGQSGIACGN
jgi:hypothetical protein